MRPLTPSRRPALLLALVATGLSACSATARLDLPDVPGAKSALLVLPDAADGTFGLALDLESPAGAGVALDPSAALFALLYPSTLTELAMKPGRLVADDGPTARPLPATRSAFVLTREDDARRWTVTTSTVGALAGLRILGLSAEECAPAGGCMHRLDGAPYCEVPCSVTGSWADLIEPPHPPERPRFEACPEGWAREVPTDAPSDVFVCTPPPRVSCDPPLAQQVGAAGCAPIGAECPSGQWPEGLPAGTLRVRAPDPSCVPDATTFCTLAAAVSAAPDGAVIVLAKGSYPERATLAHPVTLRGACAAETVLTGPPGNSRVSVLTVTSTVTLGDLTLATPGARALDVTGRGQLTASALIIRDAGTAATISGRVNVEQLLVAHTGAGLHVTGGGTLNLRQSVLDHPGQWGVRVDEGGTLRVEGSVIEGASSPTEGGLTLACTFPAGAVTRASYEPRFGFGIAASKAEVHVARTLIEGSLSDGLGTADSPLTVEDLVLRHNGGDALTACGGSLRGARLLVTDNAALAVHAEFAAPQLSDLVVLRNIDAGFLIETSSVTRIQRAYADQNHGYGLLADVRRPEYRLVLEDLDIRRTGTHDLDFGNGLTLRGIGAVELHRIALVDNGGGGLLMMLNGPMTVTDLSAADNFQAGISLNCNPIFSPDCGARAGVADVTRARLDRNGNVGAYVQASELTITDVVIRSTQSNTTRKSGTAGAGTFSATNLPGRLTLERFAILDNPDTGLAIAPGGEATLHHGEISGSTIGVSIAPGDFDVTRLEDDVIFRDNDLDVQGPD